MTSYAELGLGGRRNRMVGRGTREYQAGIRRRSILTQVMECREHGLVPAVLIEGTLRQEDDFIAAAEYHHRLMKAWPREVIEFASFRVSWVTVRCRGSKCMTKAIMCKPERRSTIHSLFEALGTYVSQSEYPVTHGARFTKIDVKREDTKDRLEEAIGRQRRCGDLMICTKIMGISNVDPFTFVPGQALLSGFESGGPNTQSIVQMMLAAKTEVEGKATASPVEKVVIDRHQGVLALYAFKKNAKLLLAYTKLFASVAPNWVDKTGCGRISYDASSVLKELEGSYPPVRGLEAAPPTVTPGRSAFDNNIAIIFLSHELLAPSSARTPQSRDFLYFNSFHLFSL